MKHINYNLLTIERLLDTPCVISTQSNNRKVIHLDNHINKSIKKLKELLTDLGCFEFYSTNSGERIIGLSQVIYFVHSGFKAYANGYKVSKNIHEVHHIDGDVTNNSPGNLILLSSLDHHLVTSFQKANIKKLANFNMPNYNMSYLEIDDFQEQTPFNNQGKRIKNHKHFLCNIIAKTIIATSQSKWLTNAIRKNIPIAEVDKLVSQYNPAKYDSFYKDQLLDETHMILF